MIIFTGYGLAIVLIIYIVIMYATIATFKFVGPQNEIILLLCANLIATAINYIVAKQLNKNGIKHTAYDVKLETFVLVVGLLFVGLIIIFKQFY